MRFIFFILYFLSINSVYAQSFTLLGNLIGKKSGLVVLKYTDNKFRTVIDTAKIANGRFKFKGFIKGAHNAFLENIVEQEYPYGFYERRIFLEPGITILSYTYGNLREGKISGSSIQSEMDNWNLHMSKLEQRSRPVIAAIDSLRDLFKKGLLSSDSMDIQISALSKKTKIIYDSIKLKCIDYIEQNPDSYLSVYLLNYFIGRIPNDSLLKIYSSLTDKVKNSSQGYVFNESFKKYKNALGTFYPFSAIEVQKPAPDFSIFQPLGKSINLKDFLGKVVLLEFWEITCLPCLKSNLKIEELRKKYENEGFSVIGISSDRASKIEPVISYINDNKLNNWIHVHIGKKNLDDSICRGLFDNYYDIEVPRTVLINRNGIVVYISKGYESDNIQKIEHSVSEIINK